MLRSASAFRRRNLARASRARAISLSVRASSIAPLCRIDSRPTRCNSRTAFAPSPTAWARPERKKLAPQTLGRSHRTAPENRVRRTAPRPVWHGACRDGRTHGSRATHPRRDQCDAPREGFRPEGARPRGSLRGLDSVTHSCTVRYGAEARPRRSRGHARTPPLPLRETCRPQRVSTLPRPLVDSPRQPGPRSPAGATHSTRPSWIAPYPP